MAGRLSRLGYSKGGVIFRTPGIQAALLFLLLGATNLALGNVFYRPDDIDYALQARWGTPNLYQLLRAEHLLWIPWGRWLTTTWQACFPGSGPLEALQTFHSLCGAATIAILYLTLRRVTGKVLPALLGASILAFSYSFWYTSLQVKMYPPGTLLLSLAVYQLLCTTYTRPFQAFVLGVTSCLAGLFGLFNFLIIPVTLLLWAQGQDGEPRRGGQVRDFRGLWAYAAPLLLLGAGSYLAAAANLAQGPLAFWDWLSRKGAPTGFYVTNHSLSGVPYYLKFLLGALTGETQIRPFAPCWPLDFFVVPALLLAWGLVWLRRGGQARRLFPRTYRLSLYLGGLFLLAFWVMDHTNGYNYVLFLPLGLLAGLLVATDDASAPTGFGRGAATWVTGLLVAVVFFSNFTAKILPGHYPANNEMLSQVRALRDRLSPEVTVVAVGIYPDATYLQFFSRCKVLDMHAVFQESSDRGQSPYLALGKLVDAELAARRPVYLFSSLYFMDPASSFDFLPPWMKLSKDRLVWFFQANYALDPLPSRVGDGQLIRLQRGSRPLRVPPGG